MHAPILLFPGQATEAPGMSKGWEGNPAWAAVVRAAEAHSGYPLGKLMAEGPSETLKLQRIAPCAVLAHSVGLYAAHRAMGMPLPAGASGHSMGFFSTVVAAGVVPIEGGLDLLRATEDNAEARFEDGSMGMAYVIGLTETEIRVHLEAHPEVLFSNFNGQAQFTVSGPRQGLVAFLADVEPAALKSSLLPVRLPIHCDHMAPLIPRIKAQIDAWTPRDPAFPLVSPLDGRIIRDGFEAWEETIVSVAAAIHWPRAIGGLKTLGDQFFECGFGPQLMNLSRWIDRGLRVESLQSPRNWA